jgi:hypothetical protein
MALFFVYLRGVRDLNGLLLCCHLSVAAFFDFFRMANEFRGWGR